MITLFVSSFFANSLIGCTSAKDDFNHGTHKKEWRKQKIGKRVIQVTKRKGSFVKKDRKKSLHYGFLVGFKNFSDGRSYAEAVWGLGGKLVMNNREELKVIHLSVVDEDVTWLSSCAVGRTVEAVSPSEVTGLLKEEGILTVLARSMGGNLVLLVQVDGVFRRFWQMLRSGLQIFFHLYFLGVPNVWWKKGWCH
ncbi:unnamed protein product [Lupinus luteus]|uniref:Uncharacterized protein n=1 Tax=Lupinus luteus TaxID=3873 RepID=A0AAV1XWP8_LUPLU